MSDEKHTQCQWLMNFEPSLPNKGWHHLCIQMQLLLCIPSRAGRQYCWGGTSLPFVNCPPSFHLQLLFLRQMSLTHVFLYIFHNSLFSSSISATFFASFNCSHELNFLLDTSVHSFPGAAQVVTELHYIPNSCLHFYSAF